jgi:steroid delta-isomerase-like uncharacterized protein
MTYDGQGPLADVEGNKRLVRRYYDEVLSGRNDALLSELLDPEFISHGPGGISVGVEGYALAVAATHAAFEDLGVVVYDQVAENDKVVTRWSATGTQTGVYVGVPASHREVTVSGIHIHTVRHARLLEHWEEVDALGALRQMGALG